MELLWGRMVGEYYAENPTAGRFNSISVSMLWSSKATMTGAKVTFPCLKGKGYEVKVLMPALLWLWEQYRVAGNP